MPHPSRINRQDLLSTASALLERAGAEGVSMRELGRQLGVSAPSLYFHVESRDDLFRELIGRGLEELGERLERAGASAGTARERVHAMATAYLGFAEESPQLFALVFGPCTPERQPDVSLGERASAPVLALGAELVGEESALFFTEALWSMVHGYTLLRLAGQFRINPNHEAGFRYSLDLLVDAAAHPPAPSPR
ncbi:MAG: TetR/AcrR family transcriptional regulator [Dehalococcoidia bacterium]